MNERTHDVHLEAIELRSIRGIGRDLAWRIAGAGPFDHRTSKPRVFQRDLQNKVRGIGPDRAGQIYLKLVREE